MRGCLFCLLFCLLSMPSALAAKADVRMQLELPVVQNDYDPYRAVQQALDILWQRLLPSSQPPPHVSPNQALALTRELKEDRAQALIRIRFDRQAVFAYLQKHHIAYLAQPLYVQLVLQVSDRQGMLNAEVLAQVDQQCRQQLAAMGVQTSLQAKQRFLLQWQALSDTEVQLVAQSNAANRVSQRHISLSAEPLAAWCVQEVAVWRDAQAKLPDAQTMPLLESQSLVLEVQRVQSLSEQVVLEQSLQGLAMVQAIQPVFLTASLQRYRLLVRGEVQDLAVYLQQQGWIINKMEQVWQLQ